MGKTNKVVSVILTIISVVMIVILVALVYVNYSPAFLNLNVGSQLGSRVGRALGSMDGFLNGTKDGIDDGKKAGLSAKDTEVEISNKLTELQKLEVLVASVKIDNIHSIGNPEDPKYMVLYLVKGNVVFSVDYSKAIIEKDDSSTTITLPEPEGILYFSQSEIEKVAEYQKFFFTGSAEDGFDAYLNSMREIQNATTETLNNYDSLLEAAKESARKQTIEIIENVNASINTENIIIEFSGLED